MERIGLIGAGLMGTGIAKNLLKAGHSLLVHKRVIDESDQRIRELRKSGAELTAKPDQLFEEAELLLTCLPSSIEVEQILIGQGGLCGSSNPKVRTVVDFTTAKPSSSQKIEPELAKRGIGFLDAPMTGGPKQADEGALNLAIGGNRQTFERCEGIFKVIAKNIIYVGPSGSGNILKLANNFLGMLNRCSTSALCLLVEKMGVSRQKLHDFVSVSGGYSRGFESQVQSIAKGFPLSFALKLSLKDIRYVQETFASQNMEYGILNDLASLYQGAADAGYGDRDNGTIYEYMKQALSLQDSIQRG
ncbi:MAG TPA: NAD(P)-dependent oxidoreductase [Spirochaetia bacterium]|nr:NAD(P)-dependent oxidoreductase [Spirochaetia bacterium]